MTTAARAAHRRPPRSPRRTAGPHFAGFCERFCRHTKGRWLGQPLVFEPFQHALWNEALRLDKHGHRVYRFVLSGRPRKNYKTTECGALALYLAGPDGEPAPDVAIGSGSKEQAGLVFNQAHEFVGASPRLRRSYRQLANIITIPARHGIIRRVSSEGGLQMGLNLSGAVLDELHVFLTGKQRELYSAIVTATGAREEPLIAAITTAGWDRATLLGELFDAALGLADVERYGRFGELIVARDLDAGFLMWWYGAPDDADVEDRELWRACNPAASITLEFLEQQWASPAVSEPEFRRLHLNQWTAAVGRWIADDVWRSGDTDDVIPQGSPVYVGVDAALTHDTTAVDWAWRDPNGRVLHECRVWSARANVPHDVFVDGGRIDLDEVEHFIAAELAPRMQVREVVYDPTFFESQASRLAKRGLRVAPLPQGSRLMAEAIAQFYVDVHEGLVLHAGGQDGAVMRAHVEAAAATQTERGWQVSKRKSSRPIDALIAMVMAHSRAARQVESVYERRGLLVLGDEEEQSRRRPGVYDDDDDGW